MRNKNNKSALRNLVMGSHLGDVIYISAIGLTNGAVDLLRYYIKTEVLSPLVDPLKYNFMEDIVSGNVILPQCDYIISK